MRGRLLEVLHRKGKNSRHKSGTSTLRGSTTNQRSRVRARSDSWRGVGIDAHPPTQASGMNAQDVRGNVTWRV